MLVHENGLTWACVACVLDVCWTMYITICGQHGGEIGMCIGRVLDDDLVNSHRPSV